MPDIDPPGWGGDSLSRFVSDAHQNSKHTFVHNSKPYGVLRKISDLYVTLGENLNQPKPWFPIFFFHGTYTAYMAAARLVISGQLAPAQMVMRGCLENALYAFYLSKKPDKVELFLRRQDSDEWRKRMKKEFQPSAMFQLLSGEAPATGKVAQRLYDRTIDNGAHPNVNGLLAPTTLQEAGTRVEVSQEHFVREAIWLGACFKCLTEVGICSLEIFRVILPERFAILGLTEQMEAIKRLRWRAPKYLGLGPT